MQKQCATLIIPIKLYETDPHLGRELVPMGNNENSDDQDHNRYIDRYNDNRSIWFYVVQYFVNKFRDQIVMLSGRGPGANRYPKLLVFWLITKMLGLIYIARKAYKIGGHVLLFICFPLTQIALGDYIVSQVARR